MACKLVYEMRERGKERECGFEFFSAEFYGHVTITFGNLQLFGIEF